MPSAKRVIADAKKKHGVRIEDFHPAQSEKGNLIYDKDLEALVRYALHVGYAGGYAYGKRLGRKQAHKEWAEEVQEGNVCRT